MNLAKLLTGLHINLAYLDVTFLPKEIALVALEVECGVATTDGKVNHDGFRPFASDGRVRQLPICSQFTKSLLWNTGTPGKYWNVLFTR